MALRRVGRAADAKALAGRFAYLADDDTPEEREHEWKRRDALRDVDAAERVYRRWAARPKPTDGRLRHSRRELYRLVGDLRAHQGRFDGAFAAHRLADELSGPGESDYRSWRNVARLLSSKLEFDDAVGNARAVSPALLAFVLADAARLGPREARCAEQEYWRLLPRLAAAPNVDVSAATFAAAYVRWGDVASARRVLAEALRTTPVRCGEFDVGKLLFEPRFWSDSAAAGSLLGAMLELAAKDAALTAAQRASMRLDVALGKARIGRVAAARGLAAEARRDVGKKDDERFELVEFLLDNPEPTLAKARDWVADDLLRFDSFFERELPERSLRALLTRIETADLPEEGRAKSDRDGLVALTAARLGLEGRVRRALQDLFAAEPRFSLRTMREAEQDEFGWDLIRRLPSNPRSAVRFAAAYLSQSVLGQRCGIE